MGADVPRDVYKRQMMHYERVRTDLSQAEKTIKTALRSTVDSETEKAALEEALELVQQAKEKCRMVQEESMQALFTRGMKMPVSYTHLSLYILRNQFSAGVSLSCGAGRCGFIGGEVFGRVCADTAAAGPD